MSHPDPKHDSENQLEDDQEDWEREFEEFMEWQQEMNQINDEERA